MTERDDSRRPKARLTNDVGRRSFITGSVATAAASGIAAATLGGAGGREQPETGRDKRLSGYRETEHIRHFYRVSRF